MKTLEELSDQELSEAFAVEVAGLNIGYGEVLTVAPDANGEPVITDHQPIPSFATEANAVLPWLEKHGPYVSAEICGMKWYIGISDYQANVVTGITPTFARAACIALLKAQRATP